MTNIIALLQVVAALLVSLQNNPQASDAVKMQAITAANQAVALAGQAAAQTAQTPPSSQSVQAQVTVVEATSTGSTNIWPNYNWLEQAQYIDLSGAKVLLGGTSVHLFGDYISFGDVNNDGLDDAVVIVQRSTDGINFSYAIAVMLNQRGWLTNVADLALPGAPTIYDHRVLNGKFQIDMQVGSATRQVYYYKLVGSTLVPQ
jgi:hypothetical protein